MDTITRIGGTTETVGRPRTTRRQDLLTALFGLWMVLGGGIDGWAHRTRGSTIESFFTPWHAALYSGFTACALWMAWLTLRPMRARRKGIEVVPVGYGLGMAGAIVFGVGGAADMLWHTIFGIEVSIEALLSPTHLILFVGAMLVLTTPLRAAWLSGTPSASPRYGEFFPVLLSVLLTELEVLFFFQYLSPILNPVPSRGFAGYLSTLTNMRWVADFATVGSIASVLVMNAIVMGFVVMLLRRWRTPPGTLSTLLLATGVLVSGLQDFFGIRFAIALGVAGLVGDLLVPRLRGRYGLWVIAATVPLVMWSAYFAIFHLTTDGLAWPVEIWSGVIAFCAFTGVALAILAAPPQPAGVVTQTQ